MDETTQARIRMLRAKITAMLAERQALQDPAAHPSRYWSDFCSTFDYMLGLPEGAFAKLRLHTYHLTGDNYQTYYFGDPEEFSAALHLDQLTSDIPTSYVINEPPGGIGFAFSSGRFVSLDTLRYQRVINTLYRRGILEPLRERARSLILEIGGGYGGLAHHLSGISPRTTYLIVDIPETLLFSACYLTLLNPNKRLYLYSPGDFERHIQPHALQDADFVLIPDYRLAALESLRFDLTINVASLQEMRTDQAERYLDFVRDTCAGVFYSWNQDRQPRNRELSSLTDLLRKRFEIAAVPEWVPKRTTRQRVREALKRMGRAAARGLGLTEHRASKSAGAQPYREYICRPLPTDRALSA